MLSRTRNHFFFKSKKQGKIAFIQSLQLFAFIIVFFSTRERDFFASNNNGKNVCLITLQTAYIFLQNVC